jgi:hypothetical protein
METHADHLLLLFGAGYCSDTRNFMFRARRKAVEHKYADQPIANKTPSMNLGNSHDNGNGV